MPVVKNIKKRKTAIRKPGKPQITSLSNPNKSGITRNTN